TRGPALMATVARLESEGAVFEGSVGDFESANRVAFRHFVALGESRETTIQAVTRWANLSGDTGQAATRIERAERYLAKVAIPRVESGEWKPGRLGTSAGDVIGTGGKLRAVDGTSALLHEPAVIDAIVAEVQSPERVREAVRAYLGLLRERGCATDK